MHKYQLLEIEKFITDSYNIAFEKNVEKKSQVLACQGDY